jgi:hypothetical protein
MAVQGFKAFSQLGIGLEGGQCARVDERLQIGSATETVHVSAEAVQVDSTCLLSQSILKTCWKWSDNWPNVSSRFYSDENIAVCSISAV